MLHYEQLKKSMNKIDAGINLSEVDDFLDNYLEESDSIMIEKYIERTDNNMKNYPYHS